MFGDDYRQENIHAGGDVAGRDINNYYAEQVSWYRKRFQKLADEIAQERRIDSTLDDLAYYNTILDGTKSLEEKLDDGGYSSSEIETARRQQVKFSKKQEKYKNYQSAQMINSHLFAEILLRFNDHVKPLIYSNADRWKILSAVNNDVVKPVIELLYTDGADDDYLCYDAEDVMGMVYYLTGICHINWKDYENV